MTDIIDFLGGIAFLIRSTWRELIKKPLGTSLIIEQIFQIGYRSLPLILITAAATSMVMTLQFGLGVERFGGTLYVPRMITLAIFKELGALFTSLMIAARVSAGIASEIGSMVVTQQIDAIRAMGTSPIQKIVIPRVVACFIAVPILVVFASFLMFFGGLLIGVVELNLAPSFYILKALDNMDPIDYLPGFIKSFFFAFCVSIPACYFGLNVKNGTKDVGIATTKAVVVSSIAIYISDFFLTKLIWMISKWL